MGAASYLLYAHRSANAREAKTRRTALAVYAVQLANAALDCGKKIPDDLSIIGFDDNVLSRFCRPAITTIHQDTEMKGILAGRILVDMIENRYHGEKEVMLPVSLVERDTVKAI